MQTRWTREKAPFGTRKRPETQIGRRLSEEAVLDRSFRYRQQSLPFGEKKIKELVIIFGAPSHLEKARANLAVCIGLASPLDRFTFFETRLWIKSKTRGNNQKLATGSWRYYTAVVSLARAWETWRSIVSIQHACG